MPESVATTPKKRVPRGPNISERPEDALVVIGIDVLTWLSGV
jgi:hypothetical protein